MTYDSLQLPLHTQWVGTRIFRVAEGLRVHVFLSPSSPAPTIQPCACRWDGTGDARRGGDGAGAAHQGGAGAVCRNFLGFWWRGGCSRSKGLALVLVSKGCTPRWHRWDNSVGLKAFCWGCGGWLHAFCEAGAAHQGGTGAACGTRLRVGVCGLCVCWGCKVLFLAGRGMHTRAAQVRCVGGQS